MSPCLKTDSAFIKAGDWVQFSDPVHQLAMGMIEFMSVV